MSSRFSCWDVLRAANKVNITHQFTVFRYLLLQICDAALCPVMRMWTNGLIEFIYGETQDMRSNYLKFKPEIGKLLIFPSYLKHFVYPFYSEGERRSMSFNAHMKVLDKSAK